MNMKRKLGMAFCTAALGSLALTASASADGPITLTPGDIAFGNQAVGTTSAAQTMTLSVPCHYVLDLGQYGGKSCSAPGKVEAIEATGDYSVTHNCPLPINNDSIDGSVVTCTINVYFTPGSNGERTAEVQLASWGQPNQYRAALTGTGFTPAPPENGNGGNGGVKDKNSASSGSGSTAGVAGKKCAKKAKKGAKKAKKCAKKKSARR